MIAFIIYSLGAVLAATIIAGAILFMLSVLYVLVSKGAKMVGFGGIL